MALTFTHIKDRYSLPLSLSPSLPPLSCTHTQTLSQTHTLSNTLSKSVPGATVSRNPICMQEAWPGQTKLVVTLQREAVNHRVTTVWESEHSRGVCVCVCTHCRGSLRCCSAFHSSTTGAAWHLWILTGRSSLLRCTTRSEPDTSPRHGGQTLSESVCLQERTNVWRVDICVCCKQEWHEMDFLFFFFYI